MAWLRSADVAGSDDSIYFIVMRYLTSLLLLLLSCPSFAQDDLPHPPVARDDGWPVASLATVGFDTEKMEQLDSKLESGIYTNVHMVVVEYDGRLVYEKYLSGTDENWGQPIGHVEFDEDMLHDLRSISKSITALLLGIALGEEFDDALSRPIIDYFPELSSQIAPGVENITLQQVLTMSTGLEWNEMDVPYSSDDNDENRLYYVRDPVQQVLTKSLRDEPGKHWYYNGGTTMVLAALVAELSGKQFLEFAHDALFHPLGTKPANVEWRGLGIWQRNLPSAASGLRLRARDLAKIGALMLHRGQWRGRQIVPPGWIRASSLRHMEQTYRKWSMDGVYGYSYQWWHGRFKGVWGDFTAITGVGYGGQRLFIVPEKKLSVTVFAGNYGTGNWRMSERVMSRIVAAAP